MTYCICYFAVALLTFVIFAKFESELSRVDPNPAESLSAAGVAVIWPLFLVIVIVHFSFSVLVMMFRK